MSKVKILDKKSEKSINTERLFLSKLHNSFIVNMHYAFQDSDNLYLVMDLMSGGDLRYHISRHKTFSEEQTRFFICGIIIALEYIHENNVIHRDIKPENLVLDNKGYIRLTDFGIAKENLPDNSSETSGTPGYMSPEVMNLLNHSFPVDFFALGVIGYEFMKGERPFNGKNRNEIKEQMMNKNINLNLEEISEGWSKESADFINKLLIIEPEKRIGYRGINELKNHLWLRYYPWDMLYNKALPSPFIPENDDNFDKTYCESTEEISKETQLRYEELFLEENYHEAFKNFYYNIDEDDINKKENKNKIKKKNISNINTSNNINKNEKDKINNNKEKEKNKNLFIKKRKKKDSVDMTFNTSIKKEKISVHRKAGSVIYNSKHNNQNLNNITGNVSNNIIYINFNINDPNIPGNLYKSYQDNSPKLDRKIKSNKKRPKSNFYQNKILNKKSLLQKIGINLDKLVSPIHSIKHIKKSSLTKKNNNIPIFEIYNNNRIKKKMSESYNNTTFLETSIDKQIRFSEIVSFKKNKNLLLWPKNEIDMINISEYKNKTDRESLNKIGKIELKKSLKNYGYNNYLTNRLNISNNKINTNYLKKAFYNHHSPFNKKNMLNNISSKPSTYREKPIKTSRENANRNNTKNNEFSLNKYKTFLNNYSSNKKIMKNYETKNFYININKLSGQNKLKNKNINNTNSINSKTRDKNTSFDNFQKDIIIDTEDFKKNKIKIFNISNNKEKNKIALNQKGTNFILSKNYKYFSNNDRYNKIKDYQTNNLSISSITINNKNKELSNNNLSFNISKLPNNANKMINNKLGIRTNKITKRNIIIRKKNQIIFSYKKKQK